MLFIEISIFASDVLVSKNRPNLIFFVMESHEKSWNLNFQKEYEPCTRSQTIVNIPHFAPLNQPDNGTTCRSKYKLLLFVKRVAFFCGGVSWKKYQTTGLYYFANFAGTPLEGSLTWSQCNVSDAIKALKYIMTISWMTLGDPNTQSVVSVRWWSRATI